MSQTNKIEEYSIIINPSFSFHQKTITIGNGKRKVSIELINSIRKVLNLNKIKTKKEYFQKMLDQLFSSLIIDNNIFSKNNKSDYLNYLLTEIKNTKPYLGRYFLSVFPKRLDFFNNITTLKCCEKTKYEHNTVTGRIKVTSGTNYLTMKKEDRSKLFHHDNQRSLYEIDFKSCEPNFYLKSQNINFEGGDIYNFLKEKFNIRADRDKIKKVVLSTIYGANTDIIAKISRINKQTIKEIKSFFQIESFKSKLELEYEKQGYIKNFYGRPLLSKNNLINHWIQSSSADYCFLSFKELLNQKNIQIHGVIHDAIIVSSVKKITLDYLTEPISNLKIPVEIKKLTNNY